MERVRAAATLSPRRFATRWLIGSGARPDAEGPPVGAARIASRRLWPLRSLIMAITLAAMLPLLTVLAAMALRHDRTPDRRQLTQQLMKELQSVGAAVDAELAGIETAASLAALGLAEGDPALDQALLRALLTSLRAHDAGVLVRLRPPTVEPPVALAMAEALTRGRLRIANLETEAEGGDAAAVGAGEIAPSGNGRSVVHLLQPVLRGGRVTAVLDVAVTRAFFAGILARTAPSGLVVLRDEAGHVVASTGSDRRADGPPGSGANGLAGADEGGLAGRGGEAEPSTALQARARMPRADGWQLSLWRSTAAAAPDPQRLALLGGFGGLAVLAGLATAAVLGGRLALPLRSLTQAAAALALASDQPPPRSPASPIAEFESLRLGLLHAGAVLRRRLAAERVALREARTGHDLLDSVLNATAECISVKDLDLRYVLINRAALQFWPEPLDEWQVLGRCAVDLYPAPVARRIELADRAVLASGRMTSFELDLHWPDQPHPVRWLWVTVTPWRDTEGRVVGVVTVSRDVTEQRTAGIRLRGMQADLLRTTRLSAMGAMASGLAHELNQPLAAATNYLNASARLLDRPSATRADLGSARGAVSDAAQQLLRAGTIVRRLRDFVGRGEAELQPEDVDELLRSVVDLARADGITRGMELHLEPCPRAATVLVDRTQIQQVLLNLIRNAAEAIAGCEIGRAGGGVIRIEAAMAPAGDATCIDVTDNGPGLAPEIVERLFQPFVSTKPAGMGIGLTICHTIAQGHGGGLAAEPVPGGGLRFRLSLPPVPQPALSSGVRA